MQTGRAAEADVLHPVPGRSGPVLALPSLGATAGLSSAGSAFSLGVLPAALSVRRCQPKRLWLLFDSFLTRFLAPLLCGGGWVGAGGRAPWGERPVCNHRGGPEAVLRSVTGTRL